MDSLNQIAEALKEGTEAFKKTDKLIQDQMNLIKEQSDEMTQLTFTYERMIDLQKEALKEAVKLIQYWHNFPHQADEKSALWDAYKRSPEMQRILKFIKEEDEGN